MSASEEMGRPKLDVIDCDPDRAARPALRGKAIVVAPFPPMAGATSAHAAEMVWLLKRAGYRTTTVSSFGTALARHQVSFCSRTRCRDSVRAVGRGGWPDLAVVYVRMLDFQRISKPYWYKRRLEEIRRLWFLNHIVHEAKETVLVLEEGAFT